MMVFFEDELGAAADNNKSISRVCTYLNQVSLAISSSCHAVHKLAPPFTEKIVSLDNCIGYVGSSLIMSRNLLLSVINTAPT